ncbi:MAG: hypothetical protein ACOYJB_07640 [Christensenellaceae bacterium]|jgi:hypothetical protein
MVIELSIIIAIIGCFVGVAGWLRGRDSKISTDSEWKGTVNAQLEMILKLLNESTADHSVLAGRVEEANDKNEAAIHDLDRRVTITEQSVKSAHRRLDGLESKN